MGKGARIRLYGKPKCEQCEKAKDKLRQMGLAYEFIDVSNWANDIEGWRANKKERVNFSAAYALYYPMPLPLFRFDDNDFINYTAGLKQAKEVMRAMKPVAVEIPTELECVA